MRQAIQCQVIDYLMKPIDKAELYDILNKISFDVLKSRSTPTVPKQAVPIVSEPKLDTLYTNQMSSNVKRIIQYIELHYTHDISLDQIADHVLLNPNYISSLFRKETGLTFIHFLHLYRIKKAKEMMLMDTGLSFHKISEQVGYESVRHFFNVFKKYSGVTPGEYRGLFTPNA